MSVSKLIGRLADHFLDADDSLSGPTSLLSKRLKSESLSILLNQHPEIRLPLALSDAERAEQIERASHLAQLHSSPSGQEEEEEDSDNEEASTSTGRYDRLIEAFKRQKSIAGASQSKHTVGTA